MDWFTDSVRWHFLVFGAWWNMFILMITTHRAITINRIVLIIVPMVLGVTDL